MILEMFQKLVFGIFALDFKLAIFAPEVTPLEPAFRRLNEFRFGRLRND